MTVDIAARGSGFIVARGAPIRLAGPQNSTSRVPKGNIPEKTVGDRIPEWERKSADSSGRGVKRSWKGDPLPRGWVGVRVVSDQELEFHSFR